MASITNCSQKPNFTASITVRPSTTALIPTLQHLERTAATLFSTLTPSLAFIASQDPLSGAEHQRLLREGVGLIASVSVSASDNETSKEPTEVVAGFLAAEMLDDCVFVAEMSVGGAHQGMGIGGALLRALFAVADGDEESQAANVLFDVAEKEARERLRGWKGRRVSLTTYLDVPWNGPWYVRRGFLPVEANNVAKVLGPAHREKLEEEKKELERDGWVRGCFVRPPSGSVESIR